MMKRAIICFLTVVIIMISLPCITAYADSADIKFNNNVTVGSNVTVTLAYTAPFNMFGLRYYLQYDPKVLQFVSGGTNSGSTVTIVESEKLGDNGTKTNSSKVVFKAKTEGSSKLTLLAEASGGIEANVNGSAGDSKTLKVVAKEKSKNTDLSSLTLSDGKLDPEFDRNTTKYTASVRNTVDKVTISANAAAGTSTVDGLGTFDLDEGENKFILTVKAESGNKKTYTVTVKRMTEEETAEADRLARENDPYLLVIDGKDRRIVPDLSALSLPQGYRLSTIERKGAAIDMLSDEFGKYELFWVSDENGADGAFYNRDENDEFTRVKTVQAGGKLYVIEPFPGDTKPGNQFVSATYTADGTDIECYKYADSKNPDFYIFYAYVNGKNGYYMFDAAEGTMQRALAFTADSKAQSASSGSLIERFKQLGSQAKIVLLLLAAAALLIVVLIVLLIIRAASGKEKYDDEDESAVMADAIFESTFPENAEPTADDSAPEAYDYTSDILLDTAPVAEPAPEPQTLTNEEINETVTAEQSGEPAQEETVEFLDENDDF